MDVPDIELLRRYAADGDESCFEELVRRHIGLVYSTALRHVGGDSHLAEDVAQVVFTRLVRNAKSLLNQRALAGWLFRDAYFAASKLVRAERRRARRERQAMTDSQDSAPGNPPNSELLLKLDELVSSLRPAERDALVLRFLQGLDLRTAASTLGISEDAAQKRVERAVHRLRGMLASKGITASSGVIVACLVAGGSAVTPPSLAALVSAASLAGVAAAKSSTVLTLVSSLTMTKLKVAASVLVLAGLTSPILVQQAALTKLRDENRQLRLESQHLLAEAQSRKPVQPPADNEELERLRAEHMELMRLRGEVGVRRRQIEELKAKLDQASHQERKPEAEEPQQDGGRYYAVENWANLGYREPESAAITFFWALRNKDQNGYSGAVGKDMPAPSGPWAEAFNSVKGSFVSPPEKQPNGEMKVSVAHETASGEIANTFLTYRQENGQWLIRQLAGFPIVLVETSAVESVE